MAFADNLSGTILRVGPGRFYSTITDAFNAASVGDIIMVEPGTYNEQIQFVKQVHLVGDTTDPEADPVKIKAGQNGVLRFDGLVNTYPPIGDGNIYVERIFLEGTGSYDPIINYNNTTFGYPHNIIFNKVVGEEDSAYGSRWFMNANNSSLGSLYFKQCYITYDHAWSYNEFQGVDVVSYWEIYRCITERSLSFADCVESPDVEDYRTSRDPYYGPQYGDDYFLNYYSAYYLAGYVRDSYGNGIVRTLRLYERDTGTLIQTKVSEADGSFSFSVMDNTNQYYIVALDDESGEDYNALIYDKLVPASKS